METYSSSSNSSTYLSLSSQEAKRTYQQQYLHSSLHTVRKPLGKPGKKPSIAPLPPTKTKVYKVEPINFKDLVQKLTGRASQSRRLQSVAPPPLDFKPPLVPANTTVDHMSLQLLSSPVKTPLSAFYLELMTETLDSKPQNLSDSITTVSNSLGFSLSPSSHGWCSFPLLSPGPGTLSGLQSTVI